MSTHSLFVWPADAAVIIPAYQAGSTLNELLSRLRTKVPREHIMVVNDGSRDATQDICAKHEITCINHVINRGKGAALRSAFTLLCDKYTWLITMDCDGQHAIADLPLLLYTARAKPRTALCIGKRSMNFHTMPFARVFSNRMTSAFLSLLTGQRICDAQCGYRVYNTNFLCGVTLTYDHFELESEVILKACAAGWRVCFAPVQTLYFPTADSHISHLADTLRWLSCVYTTARQLRHQGRPQTSHAEH